MGLVDMSEEKTAQVNLSRRRVLKYGLYGTLAAGLGSSLWINGCSRPKRGQRQNVILITVDTLRPDHLSCYGYHRNTSPNIGRFREDAVLFENCFSQAPETLQSCISILTGFLPYEAKTLPQAPESIAEIMQREGYKTAAVISNYVLRKGGGYEIGFTTYDDTMNEHELVRKWPERTAGPTTDRTIELLKQLQKDDFFMWIHYQDPHGPYTPPERFAKMFLNPNLEPRILKTNASVSGDGGIPAYQQLQDNRDYNYYVSQYDGEIRYQDEHFKRLIDALKKLGLYDEALIIFSSDHGEGMGEHDYFFAHGENLYSCLTHVPLIIKYGREPSGHRDDFVQHIDIVSTILKVLGIKPTMQLNGGDLRTEQNPEREIFAENRTRIISHIKTSLIRDGLKLIYTPVYQQFELFDLKTDPREEQNLIGAAEYQEKAGDMKNRLMRKYAEELLRLGPIDERPEPNDEEREKLKSLGYIR
jgi:arylsulfatase A-like enzyme